MRRNDWAEGHRWEDKVPETDYTITSETIPASGQKIVDSHGFLYDQVYTINMTIKKNTTDPRFI